MQTGTENEQKIWDCLTAAGINEYGAAGLMGNLYAESGLNPKNLQNTFEKKLGFTDATYTAAVDAGTYSNFARDGAGYGLCQWTYQTRKAALLQYAKSVGKSVGDLDVQLAYLLKELVDFRLLNALKTAASVKNASDLVLLKFEKPSSMNEAFTQKLRLKYSQEFYEKYAAKNRNGGADPMSNSPLVTYKNITKNKTRFRNHTIDTITIHCYIGQVTAKQGCDYFANTDRQASSNYIVGKDGSIGLSVDEKDRSWCSSNAANDNRAVTIEVASDSVEPYKVTDAAYKALIELCADICKRNGIKKLIWSENKNDRINHLNGTNMTCHRDFAAKSCPGTYLYSREGDIASKVNEKIGAASDVVDTLVGSSTAFKSYAVRVTASSLNIRKGPGTGYAVNGTILDKGKYTIVEESKGTGSKTGWGKLKSGAGWISLDYCEKVQR